MNEKRFTPAVATSGGIGCRGARMAGTESAEVCARAGDAAPSVETMAMAHANGRTVALMEDESSRGSIWKSREGRSGGRRTAWERTRRRWSAARILALHGDLQQGGGRIICVLADGAARR